MLPLFFDMGDISFDNPREAVRQLAGHIKKLENQLYAYLTTLDETNFSTDVSIESLNVRRLTVKGSGQGSLVAGVDEATNSFDFRLTDSDGADTIGAINTRLSELEARVSALENG